MLEKTMRVNDLFDFYQPLLTSKQRRYMTLYYLDDYSLGEIAVHFEVSRQAVYDTLKRTEVLLETFEEQLTLYDKFEQRNQLLSTLKQLVKKGDSTREEMLDLIESLQKLE
jgi:predicted DNA-binding protein YlxM (UPF0122 family)